MSSCSVLLDNPFSLGSTGELTTDRVAFVTTDGSNPGPEVVDKDFIFACASSNVMLGLAARAVGIAGFGRNRVGMPIQLAVEYGLQPKFSLCLTGGRSDGVIFIGDGPYKLLLAVDATPVLYTPLIINRVRTAGACYKGEKSVEYIGIKSIKVNNKALPVNTSLLAIDRHGNGGTKISTTTPYTTLKTSIYKALTGAFATSLKKIKRVTAVGKFRVCYNATDLSSTRVGPGVPQIDFVMQNNVTWTMFGALLIDLNRHVAIFGECIFFQIVIAQICVHMKYWCFPKLCSIHIDHYWSKFKSNSLQHDHYECFSRPIMNDRSLSHFTNAA